MIPTITVRSGSTVRFARATFPGPVTDLASTHFSVRKTSKPVTVDPPNKKKPATSCPPRVALRPLSADGSSYELAFSVPDGVWGIFYTPVLGGPSHEVATFHQLYGDIGGSGTITSVEQGKLASAIDTSRGSPGYDDRLDHNSDGHVDALDVYRGPDEGWSDDSVGTSWSY